MTETRRPWLERSGRSRLQTERLLAEHDLVATVADRIRKADPRVVVISGGGSSGNVGTFLRFCLKLERVYSSLFSCSQDRQPK
jgi:fructoselysine-6-P-deglycase FrlB-like protein